MQSAGSFLASHWQKIAVAAVSTAVFVGVTALTGGLGAPVMLALLAGGVSSGVAGYALGNYLDHVPITLKGALLAGAVSGVLTVATAGVGRVVAPFLPRLAVPALDELASSRIGSLAIKSAVNAAAGTLLGAGQQVALNAVERHPLGQGVGEAAFQGGLNGAFMPAAERLAEPLGVLGAAFRGRAPDVALTHGTSSSDAAFTTGTTGSDTGDLPPPIDILALPDAHVGSSWQRAEGNVFVNGVAAADVRQGNLANCFLVASMAAVADDRPAVIQNMIELRPDGNYNVTLSSPSTLEPTTTSLTSAFPMNADGTALFSKLTQPGLGQNELWAPLVEKAYAAQNGGYAGIGNGGQAGQALTALLGQRASTETISEANAGVVWNRLLASDKNDWPTVVDTPKTVTDSTVVGWHSYTFLGTKTDAEGHGWVTLRNPWGYNPGSDGVFDMPFWDFVKNFTNMSWVPVDSNAAASVGGGGTTGDGGAPGGPPSSTTGLAGALGAAGGG